MHTEVLTDMDKFNTINEDLISFKDLSVIYSNSRTEKIAVDRANFDVKRGEIVGIVGESGAGKSTIGKAVMGLIEKPSYATGEIMFHGRNILTMSNYRLNKTRWNDITMIFQASMNSLNPIDTVEKNFLSILRDKMNIHDLRKSRDIIDQFLTSVNLLPQVRERYPHELSGGMKQRILIAMAMITNPELVIADEPTTALDIITEYFVLSILKKKIKASHASMIYITHDLPSVVFIADRIIVMNRGRIVEQGEVQKVITDPEDAYTKLLVSTMESVD